LCCQLGPSGNVAQPTTVERAFAEIKTAVEVIRSDAPDHFEPDAFGQSKPNPNRE
jgi:hypothetical protein